MADERRIEDKKRYRRGSSYTDSEGSGSEDERPRKTGALAVTRDREYAPILPLHVMQVDMKNMMTVGQEQTMGTLLILGALMV